MPNWIELRDRDVRAVAIRIAERCRTAGRPVTAREAEITSQHLRSLLDAAEADGYLTAYRFSNAVLWMPREWAFGPKGGCCK